MFYLLFYARDNSKGNKTPIVLWLQGGPGVSGLFGAFFIHGPYKITI
jgi:carboxypeptidase C (cathepsin A)